MKAKVCFRDCRRRFAWGGITRSTRIARLFPSCLEITAESEDGIIMGVRHGNCRLKRCSFIPESILTLEKDCGLRLMENMIEAYARSASSAVGHK